MRWSVGRALAGAAGLVVLLAPSASAGWWDGGYGGSHDVRRHRPPGESPSPGREQPPPESNQPGDSYQPPESNQPPSCDRCSPPPSCGQCGQPPSCGQPSCSQPPAPAPAPSPPPPPPAPTTTTTTNDYQSPDAERISQEVPTTDAPPAPAVLPRHEDVLPRTGGGADGARLAAKALGVALLGGAVTRRRRPRRRRT